MGEMKERHLPFRWKGVRDWSLERAFPACKWGDLLSGGRICGRGAGHKKRNLPQGIRSTNIYGWVGYRLVLA